MCFSASASFIAAGILISIGIFALYKTQKRYHLLALIPFIFGIQQACEGLVWLSLISKNFANALPFGMYGFLFCAFIVWPIWVPWSVYNAEQQTSLKRILFVTLISGLLCALSLFAYLYTYGASAQIIKHHIIYIVSYPTVLVPWALLLYLIATVAPFFITSIKNAWLFGALLTLSYTISFYMYYQAFISVWCFFAALLSTLILFIIG